MAAVGFAMAVLPLVVTPGASLVLLTRHVGAGGRRQAVPVIAGTVGGLYVHGALALAGLSALIARSSQAYTALRLLGAAYLVALAVWTWRSAIPRPSAARPARSFPRRPSRPLGSSAWAQALLGNVLNPKAAAVYLTLVPQFLDPHRSFAGQLVLLVSVHAALIAGWLLLWTALLTGARRLLDSPRVRTAIARASALALLTLGIRSAASL
ncbi:LysE family translocator [Streptomyces profundus]|uniref:LysE family translocator n=1 Tax=Streptomyces profundus TaxID=2867410 RepID=UPI001D16CCB4|nr:LysE family translocator [Streptomyces sp. MA3_2.13]UED83332.1 LysE family translocator [Streptomyces sp. MA3_2.13]